MNMKNIGKNIAAIRKNNGYSQESLAEELNLTSQAVSKWETGAGLPETTTLIMLAKLWNTSIDSILRPIITGLEKVIDTVEIEGVKFTIIEKEMTLYAGAYDIAADLDSEPNFEGCLSDNEVFKIIKNSITPNKNLVLSIDYATNERPYAMLRGQETTNYNQPEGIYVIEAEPTTLIKVQATEAAWALTKKLTGEDDPIIHMAPLFGLIKHIFCEGKKYAYEFNGCKQTGNEETEIYCFNGEKYVTVPVKKRSKDTAKTEKYKKTSSKVSDVKVIPEKGSIIKFGKHDWRVLDIQNDKALLLSEKVIENRRYHYAKFNTTWSKCELHYYLNSEFYDTFNKTEKIRIAETEVTPSINTWYNKDGGAYICDNIFILSVEEIIKYFGDSGDFEKRNGWTWTGNKFEMKDGKGQALIYQYNNERLAKNINGDISEWWVRTPGRENYFAIGVGSDGLILFTGHSVNFNKGVRPAMWIYL